MENKPSPGLETLEESEYVTFTAGDFKLLAVNNIPLPFDQMNDFLGDISEEENVITEEEFIIWKNETTFPGTKSKTFGNASIFEDEEFGMPEEESLHHLAKCFTRQTFTQSKKHF